ncbi:MAG: hypothetical protein ABJB47_06630 [Actinomycetota bacterium]
MLGRPYGFHLDQGTIQARAVLRDVLTAAGLHVMDTPSAKQWEHAGAEG